MNALTAIARHAKLDARLVEAVRPIRLLAAVSWPTAVQRTFLDGWRSGNVRMPRVEYPRFALRDIRDELAAIAEAADPEHPLGRYLQQTCESWRIATRLLDALGSHRVTAWSTRMFGRPFELLPGNGPSNLEAARHFVDLANEMDQELRASEPERELSAESMQAELQTEIDRFFAGHRIRVELDPDLTAKAAASPTRIRLRTHTGFRAYDRNQLLMHEAFVHTLTGINGREQPLFKSMARGAPRTTATQEGLATLSEILSGAMDIERMKRISLRILAIERAIHGADFIEVFRFFIDAGQDPEDSFNSAQRVFRGVPLGGGAAFTKDTVYLHGLLAVHTFFRWCLRNRQLARARLLFAGKMALEDVFTLEPSFADASIAPPHYLPPWMQRANGLAGMLAFSLFLNRIRLDAIDVGDLVLGQ